MNWPAVTGLGDADARAVLASAVGGRLDARVADLIVAETRGNPLALLELPRGLALAELAGGFGLPGAAPLAGRIEDSFACQLDALPDQTRRLLLLAAADPSGDRPLVWRAAGRLGIPAQAGAAAVEAGLVEFGTRVRFRHPLVRSAAYRSASFSERQQMHAALAEATDPIADPDRRAWHRAQAAAGPDEEVAAELECSAGRAQARGGLAAAAAFLERSVLLTADPARHAERALAAAQASLQAGSARPWTCWRRRRPGRWMSCRVPGWTCCAGSRPARRQTASTRHIRHRRPPLRPHRSGRPTARRRPRRSPRPGPGHRSPMDAPSRKRLVRLRGRTSTNPASPTLTNTSSFQAPRLTYSAWLVNRSLPVLTTESPTLAGPPGSATSSRAWPTSTSTSHPR